jgi:hypothetical protein
MHRANLVNTLLALATREPILSDFFVILPFEKISLVSHRSSKQIMLVARLRQNSRKT